MAPSNEPTTFGAVIVPTLTQEHQPEDALLPSATLESPALTPAPSNEDMGSGDAAKPIPPYSPFYQHPPASFERVESNRQLSTAKLPTALEKDLERGIPGGLSPLSAMDDENPFTGKRSIEHSKECKMWPSKQTLMQERAAEKEKKRRLKGFTPLAPLRSRWARLDKKQKLVAKILIALIIVGAIVGIAVGISVAVHGTYYSNDGQHAVGQQ